MVAHRPISGLPSFEEYGAVTVFGGVVRQFLLIDFDNETTAAIDVPVAASVILGEGGCEEDADPVGVVVKKLSELTVVASTLGVTARGVISSEVKGG